MNLENLRAALDAVDDRLVALLAERAALVDAVWRLKRRRGLDVRDAQREVAMRARLSTVATAHGLDPAAVLRVFDTVIGHPLRSDAHAPAATDGLPTEDVAADRTPP